MFKCRERCADLSVVPYYVVAANIRRQSGLTLQLHAAEEELAQYIGFDL